MTVYEIRNKFGHRLIGNKRAKRLVCESIVVFPDKIINFVVKKVWFIASHDDAWAFSYDGNDFKNNHLIFLSDDLLSQNVYQIKYTIAHEVGHVILDHKNSTHHEQTKEEIKKQEKEADEFAKKYLT